MLKSVRWLYCKAHRTTHCRGITTATSGVTGASVGSRITVVGSIESGSDLSTTSRVVSVVEITVGILFPYIPCFISFVAGGNEAGTQGRVSISCRISCQFSVSLPQRAVIDVGRASQTIICRVSWYRTPCIRRRWSTPGFYFITFAREGCIHGTFAGSSQAADPCVAQR